MIQRQQLKKKGCLIKDLTFPEDLVVRYLGIRMVQYWQLQLVVL